LGYIDKLMGEKEGLLTQCETLSQTVKSLEKDFNSKALTFFD
jgi:hypothetical protein